MHSDATAHPKNEFTITGLHPYTEYTLTVKAQCQADKLLSSQESMVSFRTEGKQASPWCSLSNQIPAMQLVPK